jgi:lipopolysaccharide exporter
LSLAKKAVRGALWTITSSVGGRAIGLIGTLVLTRYLAPEEYGAVSVAVIVVMSAYIVTSLGFGQYLVANPKAGRDVTFHVTVYSNFASFMAVMVVYLLRAPLGELFGAPAMVEYVPGLVVAGTLDRLAYVPGRLLTREMRFSVLGLRMFWGEVLYACVAVGLATRGWGGMALVAGSLARAALRLLIVVGAVRWRDWLLPTPLTGEITKRLLAFGLPMWGANVLHAASRRWDNLIIAAMFGPAAVGRYNLAYNLADIPATQVGEQIGDVLLPSFARLDKAADRLRALKRASGLLGLVVFPLAIGLGAVAHTVVEVLLDPLWAGVAPLLVLLSALSVVRPIGWLVNAYLQATQRTRPLLRLEIIKVAMLLVFIWGLGQINILWACVGVGVAFAAHALSGVWVLHRDDGVPFFDLLRPLWPPLLTCVPMAVAVLGAQRLLGDSVPGWLSLTLQVAAGGLSYSAFAFVLAPSHARDMTGLLRRALRRDNPEMGG